MNSGKINIGLIGLGRLGQLYAGYLSSKVRGCCLVGVCDGKESLAETTAQEFGVQNWCLDFQDILDRKDIDAVVITTSTSAHYELVKRAMDCGRPTFCEKPLTISLQDSLDIKKVVDDCAGFLQMGFMRRFDRGFLSAKHKIEQGVIGKPVVFKSTSHDPYPPTLEYIKESGGIMIDMAIHDFDLCHWLLGKAEKVWAVGDVLSVPEFETAGDFDTAFVTVRFRNGGLAMVCLCRNGIYGYDVFAEIVGTEGTLRIESLQETPLLVLKENNVSHDTMGYFGQRFGDAYVSQLEDFVQNLRDESKPTITAKDAVLALELSLAAHASCQDGQPVAVRYSSDRD